MKWPAILVIAALGWIVVTEQSHAEEASNESSTNEPSANEPSKTETNSEDISDQSVVVNAANTDGANNPNSIRTKPLGDAFKNFRPSEEISADNPVPFPVDI